MYMDIYLENRRHPQAILIRIDWRVNRFFLGQRGIFKENISYYYYTIGPEQTEDTRDNP